MRKGDLMIVIEREFQPFDPTPFYATDGASGMDLMACITQNRQLLPGARDYISAGFKMQIPVGFEAQIRSRSGLALNHGVIVLNSPGTIDSDYRGSIGVVLYNSGQSPYVIKPGDRVAQMVIVPVSRAHLITDWAVAPTKRGSGGFGSTGIAQIGGLIDEPH